MKIIELKQQLLFLLFCLPCLGAGAQEEETGGEAPAPVNNLTLNDLGNGKVRLSWEAPTEGCDGGALETQYLRYYVTDRNGKMTQTKDLCYEDQFDLTAGEQQLTWYYVQASNPYGRAEIAYSDTLHIGDVYPLPYEESFRLKAARRGPWNIVCDEYAEWVYLFLGTYIDSQDRDQGLVGFTTLYEGATSTLRSPKINIKGVENPTLSFYASRDCLSGSTLTIGFIDEKRQYHILEEYNPRADAGPGEAEWVYKRYDLSAYADCEWIQLQFVGTGHPDGDEATRPIYIDNIRVESLPDYDLGISDFVLDNDRLAVGDEVKAYVSIENLGTQTATEYAVYLFVNNRMLAETQGDIAIEPHEKAEYVFRYVPNGEDMLTTTFRAQVVCRKNGQAIDADVSNNLSKDLYATVLPGKPFVTNIYFVEEETDGVTPTYRLIWQEPTNARYGAEAEDIVEDFEDYPAFTISHLGLWTLYDGDKQITTGIQDGHGNFVQYDNVEAPMAYQVFNPAEANLSNSIWGAHKGAQALATFTVGRWQANDDWLISPRVEGNQTIKFWAKSPDASYYGTHEQIEVLYSTTDNQPTAFQRIGESISVPGNWKEFSAQLPADAQYFAIRCTSLDQYILYLDDISFRRAAFDQQFVGYNVYRDGELTTQEPIGTSNYVLNTIDEEVHSYTVKAVYTTGESLPSNEKTVQITGVKTIQATPADTPKYDLLGRPVNRASGLYIQNGKVRLVMVK